MCKGEGWKGLGESWRRDDSMHVGKSEEREKPWRRSVSWIAMFSHLTARLRSASFCSHCGRGADAGSCTSEESPCTSDEFVQQTTLLGDLSERIQANPMTATRCAALTNPIVDFC
eukprot:6176045-Pleurochrysis_carterae.AAC.3